VLTGDRFFLAVLSGVGSCPVQPAQFHGPVVVSLEDFMPRRRVIGTWILSLAAASSLGAMACDTKKSANTGPTMTGGGSETPSGGAGGAPGTTGGSPSVDPSDAGGTGGAGVTGGANATGGIGGIGGASATGGARATGGSTSTGGAGPATGPINVLIWNNAVVYGHQSRTTAIPLLKEREAPDDIVFDTKYAHTATLPEGTKDTDADASVFTDAGLSKYDVVFFLNTTGDSLKTKDNNEAAHRAALQKFITAGGGFVGVHSATDTYQGTSWPWYVDMIGANFKDHSGYPTSGTVRFAGGVTAAHPILMAAHTASPWTRNDEWYIFTRDPTTTPLNPVGFQVLLLCKDAPFGERATTWTHELALDAGASRAGRVFYTSMGHDVSAFKEKAVMDLIVAGIEWAAHRL